MEENYLENILKYHFQRELRFEIDDKVFKTGKFVLYKLDIYHNNFTIDFIFDKGDNKVENFKVPYPFKVEEHANDKLIFFDYRLKTLTGGDKTLENMINTVSDDYTPSKYFDKILTISYD